MADGVPGIDSRYAAQFQRGYEGPALAPPTTAAMHSTRTSPVRIPGGPPATAARIPDPPSAAERPESAEQRVDAGQPAVVDEPEVDEIIERHGVLFEWALLAVGVLLFVLAALTFWTSATDVAAYETPYPSDQVLFIDARNRLAGPLLVASSVALSGWLVVRALRPRVLPRVAQESAP